MARALELAGKQFGRLFVKKRIENGKRGQSRWLCVCTCGNEKPVGGWELNSGYTQSCGCLRLEAISLPSGKAHRNTVLQGYKRKARRRNLSWELTEAEFDSLTQSPCHYCGALPASHPPYYRKKQQIIGDFPYNGIDRKDNLSGYTSSNVVPCCHTCNFAKRNLSYHEFVCYLNRVKNFAGLPTL